MNAISLALQPLVDFNRISRNVMGKYYKDATQEQREEFEDVFKTSLLKTYSKTLAEFKDEEIIILPETKKSPLDFKFKIPGCFKSLHENQFL